jgi:hypothetical protein
MMDEEDSRPDGSGSKRYPLIRPEERLPDEIDQLLALRQTWAKANVPAARRSWEAVTLPLGQSRRRGWAKRPDINVAALTILSVIGFALLAFVLMSGGGGDQIPRGPYFALAVTPSSQPTLVSAIVSTATPTAGPHAQPTKTPTPRAKPTETPRPTPTWTPQPTATPPPRPTATPPPQPTATPTAAPTATPTPQPTATPVPQPTPTPTQPPAPQLAITPNPVVESPCSGSPFPIPLTVTNTGGGTLNWSINTNTLPAGVLAISASGSLDAGQSQQVTLSGDTASATFIVDFTSNGGNVSVTVLCS